MDATSNTTTGWVKLYHPCGSQVTLPVPVPEQLTVDERVAAALMMVTAYLNTGFLVSAPGLEDGEQKKEVAFVSRRAGKDETPIVAFYVDHPKVFKKSLHVYLNKAEDVEAFEAATGLKLLDIPLWEGERDIDRDHKSAARYILPIPRPISLIYEVSEKWNRWIAENGKAAGEIEPHKLLLVRYEAAQPATKPGTGPLTMPVIRKYADGTDANPAAFAIYDAYLAQRKAAPLSADGLKAWYSNPANKALVKPAAS